MSMPGAMQDVKTGDATAQAVADAVKAAVQTKTGKTYNTFTVTHYATQVVAGQNFFLKVNTGDEHIHLRVYQALDGSRSLDGVQTGKGANDNLAYFEAQN